MITRVEKCFPVTQFHFQCDRPIAEDERPKILEALSTPGMGIVGGTNAEGERTPAVEITPQRIIVTTGHDPSDVEVLMSVRDLLIMTINKALAP